MERCPEAALRCPRAVFPLAVRRRRGAKGRQTIASVLAAASKPGRSGPECPVQLWIAGFGFNRHPDPTG